MKLNRYSGSILLLLVILAFAAGCTIPQIPATSPQTTQGSAGTPVTQSAVSANTTAPAKTADIDTTINVHYNDFTCLDIQQALGKDYLYPDQKFWISAASPGVSNVNVNVLVVDQHDSLGIRGSKPVWDGVQKKWVYEGIVPVVQFDDITTPVEKTFTIKTQSQYFICVDDRKESGINDVMLRVPVKLKRM